MLRAEDRGLGAAASVRRPGAMGLITAIWLAGSVAAAEPPTFKLFVEGDGAYRVAHEDLGLEAEELASGSLGLTAAGEPVDLWVEDGGDGSFGPGDWLEFVGRGLRGEVSHSSEHTRYNVYLLSVDDPSPARMRPGRSESGAEPVTRSFRTRSHLEKDLLLPRLRPRPRVPQEELWYWAKLASSGRTPFTQELDLGDLDTSGPGGIELSLHFRGWSQPREKADETIPDHRVVVSLNGDEIATADWNGGDPFELKVPELPASSLEAGTHTLTLEVPRRKNGDSGQDLVDMVLLNWIQVDYPRHAVLGEGQAELRLEGESAPRLRVDGAAGEELLVYGSAGSRWTSGGAGGADGPERAAWLPQPGERSFVASLATQLMSPAAVLRDKPSRLREPNRADYIIVAHPRLIDAIQPLAEFHRSRGLEVAVVDIEDVYDEFNHGILHPRALRDFLQYAYNDWLEPAPRFVLLVGDASWDPKNVEAVDENYADWTYRPGEWLSFIKNQSTPYPTSAHINHRGLIPTWNHATNEGHSASDNYFVAFGEKSLPDMAIGRLPVVEPAEVSAIVDKTIRYVTSVEAGAWRRRALFITNESVGLQRQSNRLASLVAGLGFSADKIYPDSAETSNEHHSERLLGLFNEGQLLVHFLGHGGRYIWRTGPPDLKKNHDLFTLEHLDQLEPTDRLPVVVSLTCYSAPFDHPTADSIGEKLVRIEGRGAVAVVASSWRNSPQPRWGQELLQEFAAEGATVGEAVQRAKHSIRTPMFVETYNLLGDPAVPMAAPQAGITLELADAEGPSLSVTGAVDVADFSGSLTVDLVGKDGEVLASSDREILTADFEIVFERPETDVGAVRAYAWSAAAGVDAAGGLSLAPKRASAARRKAMREEAKSRAAGSAEDR